MTIMKRTSIHTLLLSSILSVLLCGGLVGCRQKAGKAAPAAAPRQSETFRLPQAPEFLTEEGARDYLAVHWWEEFDLSDSVQLADSALLHPVFANYLRLLAQVPAAVCRRSIDTLLHRALTIDRTHRRKLSSPGETAGGSEPDTAAWRNPVFDRFKDLFEHFLWNPVSPMRNDTLYAVALRSIIALPELDDVLKERPRVQLRMALLNLPGTKATDISFVVSSGGRLRPKTLYGSSAGASYTLLFFFAPGCPVCASWRDYIEQSPLLGRMTAGDRPFLKVVAVSPEPDVEAWKLYLPQMPGNWTVGCDRAGRLDREQLYDLRATPSLYLLDADKRILLRDISPEVIEAYFRLK